MERRALTAARAPQPAGGTPWWSYRPLRQRRLAARALFGRALL